MAATPTPDGREQHTAPITPIRPSPRRGHAAELLVVAALKRAQRRLEQFDSLSYAVGARVYVHGGRWFLPDIIVTYRGKVWIIEVDGASHDHRRSKDASRDYLLRDCGFADVYRIDVEDTLDDRELDAHVERLLTYMRK